MFLFVDSTVLQQPLHINDKYKMVGTMQLKAKFYTITKQTT